MPLSAVSIGVARRGELVVGVIVDPFRDEVFSAALGKGAFMNGEAIRVGEESDIGDAVIAAGSPPNMRSITPSIRGVSALMPKCRTIRMIGSAALHFAWIANGRLTAYWEADLNSWDTAAGAVLVREAGGQITDLRGDAFGLTTRPVLASNGRTHAAILAVLTEAQVFGLDPP
jgi:myo-inositol-1(or 4)-monophosphatase